MPERVRPQEAASLQRSALLLLHTHSAFVAFSAHSAHSCYKFKMCGLTREDQANLARVYSSVDMGRFEPLYTDTARVLETHFARLAQRPHREDSACSSIKQQCAPLLTFPLFSVHARALASMRDVIAPLISQRSCSRRICACSSVLALACSAHGVPVRSSPAGDFSPFLLGLRLFSARTDNPIPRRSCRATPAACTTRALHAPHPLSQGCHGEGARDTHQ